MNILVADDDQISLRLLEATLIKWGYDVITCRDGEEAWSELQKDDAPALVILDWMMPGLDGLDLCRRIRRLQSECYCYVILLTAKTEKEDLIEGLEAGADDYLTKPFNRQELQVRLRAGRRILELQHALIVARDQMKELASHDTLTGLWNRGEIFRLLDKELERSLREKYSVTVVMADLDHFKRINDTYGHLAGDSVLRHIADRLRISLRQYDTIGRYGGEEFLIVVPDCDGEQAVALAERVRLAVGSAPINTPDGMLDVTLSLGVASSQQFSGAGSEQLVGAADAALYRAKLGGRNRVELARPSDCAQ